MENKRIDNTVNQKLTNAGDDLEAAKTALGEVLIALDAIMPSLPGAEPLKAERKKIEKAERNVKLASNRLDEIRERLSDDELRYWKVINREGQ